MKQNLWLKIASVVLAIALWVFVISRGYADVTLNVPVKVTNLKDGVQVSISETTEYVSVALRGHERVVKNLNADDLGVLVDAKDFDLGEHQIALEKDDVKLPIFVRLIGLNPSTVNVVLEEASEKSVPVKPYVVGNPKKGYRVMRMKVTPGNVLVSGGKSGLKDLNSVKTEPVDIEDADDDVSLQARVSLPYEGMSADPELVTIEIGIEKAR